MRLQLKLLAFAAVCLLPVPVHADGEVQLRGVYYREKATKVIQPMVDMKMDLGDNTRVDAHLLLDAITAASPVRFEEKRFEGGGGLLHRLGDFQVGFFGRYSYEPDYRSVFGGLRGSVDLAQKNTTLGLALALGDDDISNGGAGGIGQGMPIREELSTLWSSLSLGQLLSPTMSAGITCDFIYLDGYQANPYRVVYQGGIPVAENLPDSRARLAVFGQVRKLVPETRSTLVTGYRFYVDDWDLRAHTPEIRLIQGIVSELSVQLRFRYHWQSSAEFYREVYGLDDIYVSRDAKLSAFTSQLYGARLEGSLAVLGVTGAAAKVRADVSFEYVVQNNHFGNAIIGQVGLAIPFAM